MNLGLTPQELNAFVNRAGWASRNLQGIAVDHPYLAVATPQQFGAIGNGVADDTAAMQSALNFVGAAGGKVYIGDKRYKIGSITIPVGVCVEGARKSFPVPTSSESLYDVGSQFRQTSGTAITMLKGSSLSGVLLIRDGLSLPVADNSAATTVLTQFGGAAIAVADDDVNIDHCMIVGHNVGIAASLSGKGRLRVDNVHMDCLNCVILESAADVCRFNDVHCWPFLTVQASSVSNTNLSRTGTAFHIDTLNDWTSLIGCFAYGYATNYKLEDCSNVSLIRCGSDNTSSAIGDYGYHWLGSDCQYGLMIGCTSIGHDTNVRQDMNSAAGFRTLRISDCFFAPAGSDPSVDVVDGFLIATNSLIHGGATGIKLQSTCDGGFMSNNRFVGLTTNYDVHADVASTSRIDGRSPPATFTSTIGASSGSVTSASGTVTYRLSYKRLDYHIAITVTTNGTGAGALTATLPVAATDSGIGVGRRDGVGGQMVQGVVSGSTMSILLYDNSYPGADGSSFNITGSYSIATEG